MGVTNIPINNPNLSHKKEKGLRKFGFNIVTKVKENEINKKE